ncbi:hypothetical protein CDD81_918 [Ophiocordyceps australis]|uniref:Uncharacterized protein n=1 Tax=Ophiocordyceps australis TaxID=1399860 RepID=A0A2C5YES3_9HYPO|nr:hypothetical protein CDD81_918 [Ophiocordyceps australis]
MSYVERIEANGWRSRCLRIDRCHSSAVCFMAWATGAPRGMSFIKKMTPPRSPKYPSHEMADHASKLFWVTGDILQGQTHIQPGAAQGWAGMYEAGQAGGASGRHDRVSTQAQHGVGMRASQPPPPAAQRT